MRDILSSLAALFFAVALLMLGSGLLGTFLSVRMTLEAFPAEVTGLMVSAYYGGLVAGTLNSAKVIHRVGHIRAFTAFAGVATASVVAHGLVVSPWTWIPLRALTGFNLAGIYMVIESWLNERATSGTRGRIFSIYQITSYLGLGVGQFLLNAADPAGPTMLTLAALLFSLCLVPVALTRAIHPAPFESDRFRLKTLFERSPLGMAGCAGAGLAKSAFYGLGPVFALNAGFGVTAVSAFMGVTILGGLALQWPVGHLSDRYDRRHILSLVGLGLTGVTAAIIEVGTIDLPILLGLGAIFGGCMFTIYPLAVAHANDLIDPEDFVPASAALLFVWGLGAAITMGRLGPYGLFAQSHGIPVPAEVYLPADMPLDTLPDIYPALIKPNAADGSVGITKDAVVHSRSEAMDYLNWLRTAFPAGDALWQEYLPGPEYGIGLIGNPEAGLRLLPPLEVDFSDLPKELSPILSYESKAMPDSPYWTRIKFKPASLTEDTEGRLADRTRFLFRRLGLRDYGRFDFRVGADGEPKLMEVNPNPAWANDGKLAFMAGFAGIEYRDMLRAILEAAIARLSR